MVLDLILAAKILIVQNWKFVVNMKIKSLIG